MLHNFGMNFAELAFAFQDFLVLKFEIMFFFSNKKTGKSREKWERSEEREQKSN